MDAKDAEAHRNGAKTIQNENINQNFDVPLPPSYEQCLINGGLREREYVQQQQPMGMDTMHGQVFTIRPLVGLYPESVICPFCQDRINTRVEYVTTAKTHFSAMICCAICWPCGWCPYLMKECHDVHHYCPKCRAFIGIHSP